MKLTILAALPRELAHIIKLLGAVKSPDSWPFPVYSSVADSSGIEIVQTGMGMVRAIAALKAVLGRSTPDCIISTGFGGALYHGASPGDLVLGSLFFRHSVADGESGPTQSFDMPSALKPGLPLPEPFAKRLSGMTGVKEGSIITLEQPMEKNLLAKQIPDGLPFPVCDLETFALAEFSLDRNIPFLAVRSVSDALSDEVPPELIGIIDEIGQPKLGRLFHAVTTNPALVRDVLRLKRDSETAAQNLGKFVEELCRDLSGQ